MISIINNYSTDNNHYSFISDLIKKSTEVLVVSPFLMPDFKQYLIDIDISNLTNFTLYTILQPKSQDQFSKVDSLVSLFDYFNNIKQNINFSIRINNKIHGKIYLFKNNKEYISGIITSSNFTASGLTKNLEWGVQITEVETLKKIENDISQMEYSHLNEDELIRCLIKIDEYLDKNKKNLKEEIDLDLNDCLSESSKIPIEDTLNYWLKPIGVTGSPVQKDEQFNREKEKLYFSKRRPSGIKIGDIIIAYAVTSEEIKKDTWKERWPWYIIGKNLTKNFGKKWWNKNINITHLKDTFLNQNQNNTITLVGGKTLGALNFGLDKIHLSNSFANFIIKKIN